MKTRYLPFAPLFMMAAITLASASSALADGNVQARYGIDQLTMNQYRVNTPVYPKAGSIGFLISPTSDYRAMCRELSFDDYVQNSAVNELHDKIGRRAVIGRDGNLRSVEVAQYYVSSLVCMNYYQPTPIPGPNMRLRAAGGITQMGYGVVRIDTPKDMGIGETGLLLDGASDPNGICRGLGYLAYVQNTLSTAYREMNGRTSVVGRNGEIITVRQNTSGLTWITSLQCVENTYPR